MQILLARSRSRYTPNYPTSVTCFRARKYARVEGRGKRILASCGVLEGWGMGSLGSGAVLDTVSCLLACAVCDMCLEGEDVESVSGFL